jgi:lipoyl(octanoyl) transferase
VNGETVEVVSLLDRGPAPYDEVLVLQHEAAQRLKDGGVETLFLLEHADVITIGRNAGREDLLATDAFLAKAGIDVRVSDRGGKLTFHGPGQLVAYPVLDLSRGETDVRRYIRNLEETLIRTAGEFGVTAARSDVPERWSSIWIGNDKLAAIGVHISRWVTTHGVALNVSTDLSRFSLIVPCGITDGGVTSLARVLGAATAPDVASVASAFRRHFGEVFGRVLVERPA